VTVDPWHTSRVMKQGPHPTAGAFGVLAGA
jgi:hypothetical protein